MAFLGLDCAQVHLAPSAASLGPIFHEDLACRVKDRIAWRTPDFPENFGVHGTTVRTRDTGSNSTNPTQHTAVGKWLQMFLSSG